MNVLVIIIVVVTVFVVIIILHFIHSPMMNRFLIGIFIDKPSKKSKK